jgi:hypothetical protein
MARTALAIEYHIQALWRSAAKRVASTSMAAVMTAQVGNAVLQLGSERRSRKPPPDSPDYNLFAQSADDAGADGHFDLGRTAMLDSFTRLTR